MGPATIDRNAVLESYENFLKDKLACIIGKDPKDLKDLRTYLKDKKKQDQPQDESYVQ